jgi:GAF domain-containing protein
MPADSLLAHTLVELTDTLVADFDVVDFLHTLVSRCAELLNASDAGLMLADRGGGLQIVAYTSERASLLESFELMNNQGPCLDSFRTGDTIMGDDLEVEPPRWPLFAPRAREVGFRSVQALPMRCHTHVIGALNVFHTDPVPLGEDGLIAARVMADVATIAILQERAGREARVLAEQLQSALNSRVFIEQAKGIVAERTQLGMDDAFALIRRYSRQHNRGLRDVAKGLIDGSVTAGEMTDTESPATPEGP